MPDDMDLCQQINQERIDDALAKRIIFRPTGNSLKICIVCGEDIPEARQKAQPGCVKCIECQTEYESMHGKWGDL